MQQGKPASRMRRGPLIAIIVSASLVVLLIAGTVITELVIRSNTSRTVGERAEAIVSQMASDGFDVKGSFTTQVHGALVMSQHLSGRYEHITFRSQGVTLNGEAYELVYDAYGVPADLKGPAERIDVHMHMPGSGFAPLIFEKIADANSGLLDIGEWEFTAKEGGFSAEYQGYGGSTFIVDLSLAVESGTFKTTLDSMRIKLGGTETDLGAGKPLKLPPCESSPADIEAQELTATSDGLTARWQATGEQATLEQLGTFGLCVFN